MGATLGLNAKLYRLPAAETRASWGTLNTATGFVESETPPLDGDDESLLVEVANVKDVTIPLEFGEGDVTTRGSAGFEQVLPTLGKVPIDIPMVYDTADANVMALMTAHLTRAVVALAFLSGDAEAVGTHGLWADFEVLKMEKGEPLDGPQMITFSIKPGPSAVPPEWVTIVAP